MRNERPFPTKSQVTRFAEDAISAYALDQDLDPDDASTELRVLIAGGRQHRTPEPAAEGAGRVGPLRIA